MHETVLVKINAPIDRAIAPLVEAMNEFPEVLTLDSCQGDDERPAHVFFRSTRGTDRLVRLVQDWTVGLGPGCRFTFRIEWQPGTENPFGQLVIPADALKEFTDRFRELARPVWR